MLRGEALSSAAAAPTGRMLNVLVFPGGTEIGLEIHRSLASCRNVRLAAAGMDVSNHAPYVFRRCHVVPPVTDSGWVDRLNQVIDAERIDYVYPAYDDVLVALAEHAGALRAPVVASPVETCRVTRSKAATYRRLHGVVPVPRLYPGSAAVDSYPVFVKPDRGQGSQGTYVATDAAALACALRQAADPIIVEYLPGAEYTVDCFSDREAGLLYCRGRQRVRTKSGISMDSRPVEHPDFERFARAISGVLPMHGAWFFQVKHAEGGGLTLMEIGPRIAGTMALARAQGVNLPLLSLYEQERMAVRIMPNDGEVVIDRALVNRYRHCVTFRTAYVDLDDTLILHDKVNTELIALLYQWLNEGKRLVLLTKHARDVPTTLRTHRLSELFDEVIRVGADGVKAEHIGDGEAILIDDSFSERRGVHQALGIPTFDCSMLELLRDDRH